VVSRRHRKLPKASICRAFRCPGRPGFSRPIRCFRVGGTHQGRIAWRESSSIPSEPDKNGHGGRVRPVVVLLASLTLMRVTQKGQVTIPLEVRRALGIQAGSDVQFRLDDDGARLIVDGQRAAREIRRMRAAGDVELTTDEILALTRR
jgi:antitoxin PrlF